MILLWALKKTKFIMFIIVSFKSDSGFGLNIMQGNFTLGTLWFSTDLTFYYWNMMNQYWFTMALGSGYASALIYYVYNPGM